MKTYFVVQGFQQGRRGVLIADQPREARDDEHAKNLARRLSETRAGVIAFSRSGDPSTGDFDDAVVLAQFGNVPDETLGAG